MWLAPDPACAAVSGFSVDFYSIGLHALSSDGAIAEGRPCIYIQLADTDQTTFGDAEDGDRDGDAEIGGGGGGRRRMPRLEEVLEMKIFLDDPLTAQTLYSKLCEGAELNPDEDEDDDDDDVDLDDYQYGGGGSDGNYADADNVAGYENGHTVHQTELSRRFDDMLQIPPQLQSANDNDQDDGDDEDERFDDAEDN